MNLLTRQACPEDAEAIVGILNPIIEAGAFTANITRAFDHGGVLGTYIALGFRRQGVATLRVYQRHGFYVVGTARRHARIGGRYVDEIVIEKIFEND
jgi:L-amino acid N-acyltransferase YncA